MADVQGGNRRVQGSAVQVTTGLGSPQIIGSTQMTSPSPVVVSSLPCRSWPAGITKGSGNTVPRGMVASLGRG